MTLAQMKQERRIKVVNTTNFQLISLRSVIERKEKKGLDTAFERDLYVHWIKDPDFKKADEQNIREKKYKPLAGKK